MTVQDHAPITPTEAMRTVDAHVLVDRFRADLRLACESRAYTNEFAEGLAYTAFGGTAVLPPVGALIYLIRAATAAARQRVADPKQDCENPWGYPVGLSCAEKVLLDLEQEAADALIAVLLHGPWPI